MPPNCKSKDAARISTLAPRGRSFTKNSGAEPNARRTFFDGNFEVMRHAYGKSFHLDSGKLPGSDSVEQIAHFAEVGPRHLGIFSVRRHGHESLEVEGRELWCGSEQFFEFG